jgi:proline racemase
VSTELPVRYWTVDYHTAGEPFRIVVDGVDPPPGDTVADRRQAALTGADGWAADRARRVLCSEPRGHADMYGGFVVPPSDAAVAYGCRLGVLFWHKDGFSTACGHGTIALATWAIDDGVVEAPDDGTAGFGIEVPSGPIRVAVRREGGRCVDVAFTNVPAWVSVPSGGLTVPTSAGPVDVAVSFGGAFYASVRAADLGARVAPSDLPRIVALAREIKAFFADDPAAVAAVTHPRDGRLSGLYGSIWFERMAGVSDPEREPGQLQHVAQRNVTVFADGEVDRSPCGSGTSARLAVLRREFPELDAGAHLFHYGIADVRFEAWIDRVIDDVLHGAPGRPEGVVTTVRGSAYRTGEHAFVLDPHDEIGEGFTLR